MSQFFRMPPALFMTLSLLIRLAFLALIAVALVLAIRCMLKYLRETPGE